MIYPDSGPRGGNTLLPACLILIINGAYKVTEMAMEVQMRSCLGQIVCRVYCVSLGGLSQPLYERLGLRYP